MEIYYLCNQIANRIITMYERETLKLRVSESRANIFSALPSMCSFGQRLNFVKNTKKVALIFGGLNNLITLSLSLSLSLSQALAYIRETVSPLILRAGRPRQYTAFLASMQEKSACFLSPSNNCGGGQTLGNKHLSLTNKFNHLKTKQ